MNIVLIGTIGAGKTAVGKAISEMSELKFVDTDEVASERTMLEPTEKKLICSSIPESFAVSKWILIIHLKSLTRHRQRNMHSEYWNLLNSEESRVKSVRRRYLRDHKFS